MSVRRTVSRSCSDTLKGHPGQIVDFISTTAAYPTHLCSKMGDFTNFDVPFPNVVFTDVSGINNRGQIGGRYCEFVCSNYF